jgi:predicted type IV restriction endonuclease
MQLDLGLTSFSDSLRLDHHDGRRFVYDPLRSKWLALQPEELVRQLLVQYLLQARGYNRNRITVERGLKVNGLSKRCDLLVFDSAMAPFMLIECKAPQVALSEAVFRQIAAYNLPLQVPYLLVTNGPVSYCCRMDYSAGRFTFVPELPDYPG